VSSTGEDVFSRLGVVIDEWSAQIARSHEELSARIGAARGHLDRIVQSSPEQQIPDDAGAAETIASLRAEIDGLKAALEQARTEASAPRTAEDDSMRSALEAELEQAHSELAVQADTLKAVERALDTAKKKNESLESDLKLTREESQASEASENEAKRAALEADLERVRADLAVQTEALKSAEDRLAAAQRHAALLSSELDNARAENDSEALRAALDMLEIKFAKAQDEIRTLQQAQMAAPDADVAIDAFDARGHKKRMGEILVELGVITEVQLKSVLKEQAVDPQHRLGALVVERGFTSEDLVARILAAQLRLPYEDLRDQEPSRVAMKKVSQHVVRLHRCMPLREQDGVLTVAMVNPLDLIAIEDLELASRCRVAPVVSTQSQIDAQLAAHYPEAD